jgi:3-deoxy-7-phosphoheptulonate synthase
MRSIINQRLLGNTTVFGTMVESNLSGGRQDAKDLSALVYGQSITDACLSWDDTEAMVEETSERLSGVHA